MKQVFLFITAILVLASCEKILDEQVPAHSTVDGNVISNESTAEVALVGVYSYLANQNWEFHYSRVFGHLAGTSRGSGSSDGEKEAGFEGELIFNVMESDHPGYIYPWRDIYKLVNGANTMISLTNLVSENQFSPGRKESIIAEATFLRFFAHFKAFRMHGYFWDLSSPYGVLYRTEPSGLSNHKMARLSVADSYSQLLADLNYVIENGPEHTDIYHVSKYTAMAFKAKVLAMRGADGDYAEVIKLVDRVLTQGPFALHPDYLSYFSQKKTSAETIFGRYFSSSLTKNDIGLNRARTTIYYRSSEYLQELCAGSSQYFDAITNTKTLDDSTVTTSPAIKKIINFGTDEELLGNAAYTYMRLGELVVLKAEAIARTSGDATAVCNVLNPLLSRAEDMELNPGDLSSEALLLDAVYDVMIKEMCCETGLDFEASLRFKDDTGMPKVFGQKEGLVSMEQLSKVIMPIPIQELDINNIGMKQNPGYFGE